jgi:hypothetical protein
MKKSEVLDLILDMDPELKRAVVELAKECLNPQKQRVLEQKASPDQAQKLLILKAHLDGAEEYLAVLAQALKTPDAIIKSRS